MDVQSATVTFTANDQAYTALIATDDTDTVLSVYAAGETRPGTPTEWQAFLASLAGATRVELNHVSFAQQYGLYIYAEPVTGQGTTICLGAAPSAVGNLAYAPEAVVWTAEQVSGELHIRAMFPPKSVGEHGYLVLLDVDSCGGVPHQSVDA